MLATGTSPKSMPIGSKPKNDRLLLTNQRNQARSARDHHQAHENSQRRPGQFPPIASRMVRHCESPCGVRPLRLEPLHQRHLVPDIIVSELVDQPLRQHDPEAAFAEPQIVAHVEMGDGVLVLRGVGELRCGRSRGPGP